MIDLVAMEPARWVRSCLWVLVALGASLGSTPAGAIPAFARRYETRCQTCHAVAFPELNPFGRRFKEDGYQYPAGAEEAYRAEATLRPTGTLLDLFRQPPLSARARVASQAAAEPASSRVDLFVPGRLDVLAGGTIAPNVSAFGSVSVAPSPALHILTLGVHDLFGEGVLNLRAGRFPLLDFQRPGHRSVTTLENPTATVLVGATKFLLDGHHTGVHAWGRPGHGRFFYEAAVVQGVESGGLDVDAWKDGYLRATVDVSDFRAGALAYLGNSRLESTAGGITRTYQDPHSVLGAELSYTDKGGTLFATVLLGRHANPYALGTRSVQYLGARVQADVPVGERLLAIARYDLVTSPSEPALDRQLFTGHLTFILVPNVNLAAEVSYSIAAQRGLMATLAVDAAF